MEAKFFELKDFQSELGDKSTCIIDGLREITPWIAERGIKPSPVGGAIALLKHRDHPGYCQMFFPCFDANENGEFNIRFNEAYTMTGEKVFVKYPNDCVFCHFIAGMDDTNERCFTRFGYDVQPYATIMFPKDGVKY